jgi:ABC-type branched-subunit amino acid transport system ATPase component
MYIIYVSTMVPMSVLQQLALLFPWMLCQMDDNISLQILEHDLSLVMEIAVAVVLLVSWN